MINLIGFFIVNTFACNEFVKKYKSINCSFMQFTISLMIFFGFFIKHDERFEKNINHDKI